MRGNPCHMPLTQRAVSAPQHHCGGSGHAACLALPGCVSAVAVVTTSPSDLLAIPDVALVEPETPMVHGVASRGPPTPPPNS